MTAVTRYQSEDGRTFEKPEDAADQDKLFRLQNEVSRLLPQAVDESCKFANGGGYVQHTQEDVDLFKLGIERLIVEEFGEDSECLKFWREGNHYAGRYLCDSGSNTYRLWCRWANIDKQLREWGQGYYMLHPERGAQERWPTVTRAGMKHYD